MRFTMAEGCLGLSMQDGTQYGTPSGGSIEVERPDHVAAILASPNYQQGHLGAGFNAAPGASLPDRYCPHCSFSLWPWSTECPRCHRTLETPAEGTV